MNSAKLKKVACLLLLVFSPQKAYSFWLDSIVNSTAKSTVHYDIIKNFALCLGYPENETNMIANYSQAADIPTGFNGVILDFIDHEGPNAGYFHAPQLVKDVDALNELLKWAKGEIQVPANLPYVTQQVRDLSGTLGAFGIYLHALGDRYSHASCIDAGYVPHCTDRSGEVGQEGHFAKCQNATERALCHYRESHDNEFGKNASLTSNTNLGLNQIYSAMASWKGKSTALPPTLASQLTTFATSMDASKRIEIANSISKNSSCPK